MTDDNSPPEDEPPFYVAVPMEVRTRTADEWGRFTIGKKFANQTVTVAILDPDPKGREFDDWPHDPLRLIQAKELIDGVETDDKGRINFGAGFAHERLTVALLSADTIQK